MDKAELAIRGAANAPINKDEVRRLILVASSAFKVQAELGLADAGFDTWRKGVLWDLCGKASFRALGQKEFGWALDEFLRLGGTEGGGRRAEGGSRRAEGGAWQKKNASIARNETSAEGDRRRAEWKLREACREFAAAFGGEEGARAYARGLMKGIHRQTVETASAKQVWAVYFTLRTRGAAKLKNGDGLTTKNAKGE